MYSNIFIANSNDGKGFIILEIAPMGFIAMTLCFEPAPYITNSVKFFFPFPHTV